MFSSVFEESGKIEVRMHVGVREIVVFFVVELIGLRSFKLPFY